MPARGSVQRFLTVILLPLFFITALALSSSPLKAEEKNSSNSSQQKEPSHYYFVGAFLAHPYMRDIKLGLKYAENRFHTKITTLGPQDGDYEAQTQAMKEAIKEKPDGIIIPLWANNAVPYIRNAREHGIPVVAIEAAPKEHGANIYVGLDNYQAGVLTAQELVRRGGTKGKLALVHNNAIGSHLKKQGFLVTLRDTEWELVTEANDLTDTDTATNVAIELLRNHPELTGVVGLNSSSGVGIGNAIGQLGFPHAGLTIVVHGREKTVLEFIEEGIIDATVVGKTALTAYIAIAVLEDYQQRKHADVPVAANSQELGLVLLPEKIDVGAIIVDKENVQYFKRKNLPVIME